MARQTESSERVRLKPADSFDLIRLIARSQSDPRKAVAELVQNSLDAGASAVRVTWSSAKGGRQLSVWDDGRGVFPDLERSEALRRIATTIGHSHKAHLTAAERHRQMTLGKYGIGLLGFWSVSRFLDMRTRVAGSDTWQLHLEEDARDADIQRARSSRLPLQETFTEVTLHPLHATAANHLKPRRLAAYLAGELRGQLLQRDVRLEIHDHVARGRAQKLLVVRPQRYRGVPVSSVTELPVEGFDPARVELYFVPDAEERRGTVTLACGGATVLDDIAFIVGPDEPREPWSSGRFEGVVDFPDLEVAPSTRRGFVPNAAAQALLEALATLEETCRQVLAQEAERRKQEKDAQDARDLRRIFRRLTRVRPQYAMLDVKDHDERGARADAARGEELGESDAVPPDVADDEADTDLAPKPEPQPSMFPPGPLASLDLRPHESVLAPEGSRRLRARPLDAQGREIDRDVAVTWSVRGPGSLTARERIATYVAPPEPCEATVVAVVEEHDVRVEAEATVRVSDAVEPDDGTAGGIPEPEPHQAPAEPWRSRIDGNRWLYNTGHPDYREVQDDPKRRLRYLVHLFAKELVLRNFGEPTDALILERMVEVLTYVDNLPSGKARA